MKKLLALSIALVLAFSCMTVAFAATATCPWCKATFSGADDAAATALLNAHMQARVCLTTAAPQEAITYPCPYCALAGQDVVFVTEAAYMDHLKTCPNYTYSDGTTPVNYVDMSVSELLAYLLDVANVDNDRLSILEPIIQSLITFVENMLKGVIGEETGVEGANADLDSLEAKLTSFDIDIGSGKIKDILDAVKAKIKALYCGEPATTAAEEAPETGSASTGIAVFAAISVAAAAAYVCTKKRA